MSDPSLPPLSDGERLGRSVLSSKQARRARRQEPVPEAFLVRKQDDRVSVDRMGHAGRGDMAAIAIGRARERGREFRGWAILTAEDARANGRGVEATPVGANPFHADILLNLPEGLADPDRRDRQKQHAADLARRARWERAPALERSEAGVSTD